MGWFGPSITAGALAGFGLIFGRGAVGTINVYQIGGLILAIVSLFLLAPRS